MTGLLFAGERRASENPVWGTAGRPTRFPRRRFPEATALGIITPTVVEYLPVLVFLAMIVAFGGVSLAAAALVRPARPGPPAKLESYECGPEPIGPAWIQFPIGFYLVAIVFIVFDALVVFLFPWALVLRTLGWAAFGPMVLFLLILGLGWLYAYREGILAWR
jgi:NADH-quinone oxidoreductase subunit A